MQFVRLKNWEQYQHYKNRNPVWIKLYQDLLTSQMWVRCDDASRTLAIACMVLAAKTDNKIPLDPAYLRRVAYLNTDPDFSVLVASDFLEIIGDSESASTTLAQRYQDASPEKRRGEKEKKQLPPPSGAFLRFWAAWPSSSRKGSRGECWERWRKNDFDLVAEEIVSHVDAMKASADWLKNSGEFIPAPLAYLNKRRWEGAETPSAAMKVDL
jgi:hypothetical protein